MRKKISNGKLTSEEQARSLRILNALIRQEEGHHPQRQVDPEDFDEPVKHSYTPEFLSGDTYTYGSRPRPNKPMSLYDQRPKPTPPPAPKPEPVKFPTIHMEVNDIPEFAASVFTISDGVRTYSIDLDILDPDEEFEDADYLKDQLSGDPDTPMIIGWSMIFNSLPMFRPGAILTLDELNALRNEVFVDDEYFYFYDYHSIGSNKIFCYEIDKKSQDRFIKFVQELIDKGFFCSFIRAFDHQISVPGCAFSSAMCPDVLNQLYDKYSESINHAFIKEVKRVANLVTHDEGLPNPVHFYPHDYEFLDVTDIVYPFGRGSIEEFELDDEDEDDDDATTPEPIEVTNEPDVDDEVRITHGEEETPESTKVESDHEAPGVISALFPEQTFQVSDESSTPANIEGDTNDELISSEFDITEEEFYRSKGQKPPKPMKPNPKSNSNDDSNWVFKRR